MCIYVPTACVVCVRPTRATLVKEKSVHTTQGTSTLFVLLIVSTSNVQSVRRISIWIARSNEREKQRPLLFFTFAFDSGGIANGAQGSGNTFPESAFSPPLPVSGLVFIPLTTFFHKQLNASGWEEISLAVSIIFNSNARNTNTGFQRSCRQSQLLAR